MKSLCTKMMPFIKTNLFQVSQHVPFPILASKKPYFFVKVQNDQTFKPNSNMIVRLNRQMKASPQASHPYSFWSLSQFNKQLDSNSFSRSFISNPFKSEQMIKRALSLGVQKMVVQDIDQLSKIQMIYLSNLKEKIEFLSKPKYLWSIEETERDIRTLQQLNMCSLRVDGLYFRKEYQLIEAKIFLERNELSQHPLRHFIKQTTLQEYKKNQQMYQQLNIKAEIIDYSETHNYLMFARVLGTNRQAENVYSDECYQYLCRKCECMPPNDKMEETFSVAGNKWAIVPPNRIDSIKDEDIIMELENQDITIQE